jgi:hypothetical protein
VQGRNWEYTPGKGGQARVPEWTSGMFQECRRAILKLPGDEREEEALLCHHLIARVAEACEEIRRRGRELVPLLEQEAESHWGISWHTIVSERLEAGISPSRAPR